MKYHIVQILVKEIDNEATRDDSESNNDSRRGNINLLSLIDMVDHVKKELKKICNQSKTE